MMHKSLILGMLFLYPLLSTSCIGQSVDEAEQDIECTLTPWFQAKYLSDDVTISELDYQLIEAVICEELEDARLSLDQGASPDTRLNYERPISMFAAEYTSFEIFSLIVDRGARLDVYTKRGDGILVAAYRGGEASGDFRNYDYALNHGVDYDTIFNGSSAASKISGVYFDFCRVLDLIKRGTKNNLPWILSHTKDYQNPDYPKNTVCAKQVTQLLLEKGVTPGGPQYD